MALILERPWSRQSAGATKPNFSKWPITRLSAPGLYFVDLVTGQVPTTAGTATAAGIFTGPSGISRQQHLSAGSNGFAGWQWSSADGVTETNDATMIFVGEPQITASEYGGLLWRGLSGSGWNLSLNYNGTLLKAEAVTASPLAGHTASITHGHTMGQEQRIALIKRGTTLVLLDWRTRQTATATLPSAGLRTSTDGLRIGGWSATSIQGHHRHTLDALMPVGLQNDEVWSILDNPWQLFAPRRIFVPQGAGTPATFSPAWARNRNTIITGT